MFLNPTQNILLENDYFAETLYNILLFIMIFLFISLGIKATPIKNKFHSKIYIENCVILVN